MAPKFIASCTGPQPVAAVAGEGDRDAVLAAELLVERGAGGDAGRGADDGVVGVGAEGQEEGVHAAAHAAVEPGRAHEDLGEEAEEHEALGQHPFVSRPDEALDGREYAAALLHLHDVHEPPLVEPVDGGQALGDELAVAPVAAEDMVLRGQRQGCADRGTLLADREMRRPLVGELDPRIGAARLEVAEHRLELADDEHVAEDAKKLRVAVPCAFFRDRRLVGVHRDGREDDLLAPAGDGRVDGQFLGHSASPRRWLADTFVL